MNRRRVVLTVVMLGLLGALAACGGGAAGPSPEPPVDVDATVQAAIAATRTAEADVAAQVAAALAATQTAQADVPGDAPTATPTEAPPPPTATPTEAPPPPAPTPTPAPAPTPTPLALFVPPAQGSLGDLVGDLLIPRDALASTSPVIFGDKIDVRLQVREPSAGQYDGAGIDRVEVTITDLDSGKVVYQHTEFNSWYCAFGGGEPLCNQFFPAQNGYRWPDGEPIRDVEYEINMVAIPGDGNKAQGNWRLPFRVQLPESATLPPTEPPTLRLAQVGPDSLDATVTQALVFQVEAFDPGAGSYDGAGIDRVEMAILDESGQVVHQQTERHAGYCAFGGGDPDCNVWDFQAQGRRWPDGTPIQPGRYTLRATAFTLQGGQGSLEHAIQIQWP